MKSIAIVIIVVALVFGAYKLCWPSRSNLEKFTSLISKLERRVGQLREAANKDPLPEPFAFSLSVFKGMTSALASNPNDCQGTLTTIQDFETKNQARAQNVAGEMFALGRSNPVQLRQAITNMQVRILDELLVLRPLLKNFAENCPEQAEALDKMLGTVPSGF